MKKKILFDLIKFPEYGGISTVTSIILPKLIEAGYDVSVISHRSPNKSYDGPKDVKLYYTPNPENLNNESNWNFYNNILQSNNFDIIIYQDSYAPIEKMVCSLSKQNNIKLFVFEHNSPCLALNSRTLKPWYSLKGLIRRCFHKYFEKKEINRKLYLYKNCDKYVLLCTSYIEIFRNYTGINDISKLYSINNPTLSYSVLDSDCKKNSILFVGRLMPEKGVDKMLKYIADSHLRGTDFYIVGNGSLRNLYQKKVKSLNLSNVHIEGFRNPEMYYKQCKVFWMASKYEGWPMTLIEAMSYGCVPVVMNTFASVHDIIDDRVNGFIIDPHEKDNFIQVTKELLTNKQLFLKMSANAITKAKSFSIDIIFQQWENILN